MLDMFNINHSGEFPADSEKISVPLKIFWPSR